jgi:hypothetical protein
VTGEPDLPNVEIASRIRIVPGPCTAWRQGLAYDVIENGMLATVTFSGTETFEGGTGRFAEATGSAAVVGTASLITNTGSYETSGTLTY